MSKMISQNTFRPNEHRHDKTFSFLIKINHLPFHYIFEGVVAGESQIRLRLHVHIGHVCLQCARYICWPGETEEASTLEYERNEVLWRYIGRNIVDHSMFIHVYYHCIDKFQDSLKNNNLTKYNILVKINIQ